MNLPNKLTKPAAETAGEAPAKKLRVYKATIPSCRFVLPNGSSADFVAGVYYTDDPYVISALDAEVARKHQNIYVDKNQVEIDAEDRDPMIALKKKLRAEIVQEMAAQTSGDRDMGTIAAAKLIAANTKDIAAVTLASGGNKAGA